MKKDVQRKSCLIWLNLGKKLTQPGDKYTFLQGLVAKGYKSISDMAAICDTTNATISRNLTPLLLDRLDLLLKKVHKIKDTSIRQ